MLGGQVDRMKKLARPHADKNLFVPNYQIEQQRGEERTRRKKKEERFFSLPLLPS